MFCVREWAYINNSITRLLIASVFQASEVTTLSSTQTIVITGEGEINEELQEVMNFKNRVVFFERKLSCIAVILLPMCLVTVHP